MFTKRPGRKYLNGKVNYVDIVDCDEFSVHELDTMIKEIRYTNVQPMWYHFLIPESDLDYGLHALRSDGDVIAFLKYTTKYKLIEVYTEHWRTTLDTYFKSPKQSKVVIDELLIEEPVELKRCKKSGKGAASSSCKKQLLLGWIDSQEHGDHVSGQEQGDNVSDTQEEGDHVSETQEQGDHDAQEAGEACVDLGYRPEQGDHSQFGLSGQFDPSQPFDPSETQEHFDPFWEK